MHPLYPDGNVGEATDVHRMPGRPVVPRGETPEPSPFSHARLPTAPTGQGYRAVGYIASEDLCIGSPDRVRTIPGMPIMGVTSHPHAIVPDLTNKDVFVPDLSMNTVSRFAFDAGAGTLALSERLDIGRTSAGPRLAEVAPRGDRIFVACERDSTVSVLKFVPGEEGLEETQWVSTLPAGSDTPASGGGLALHPGGRLLYSANRGHDSVARFAIGPESHLTFLDTVPCEGQFPVHLSVSPEGGHLVVSNLLSDSVTLFRIHPDDGSLRFLNELSSPSPTCALFW